MKNALLCALLVCAAQVSAMAQDAPIAKETIQGHRIGETVTGYLMVSTGTIEAAHRHLEECSQLLEHSNPKRLNDAADECLRLSQAIDGKTVLFQRNLTEYLFSGGVLVTIRIEDVDQFAKVRRDLVEKFGPPDSEKLLTYQNGFGATFLHPQLRWGSRADAYIEARENPKPAVDLPGVEPIYTTTIEIVQRAWADKLAAEEQARPNPLD